MGRRGPPPKSARLKLLAGNPGKRPISEPEPSDCGPLGDPPPGVLDSDEVACWHELAQVAPWLERPDRIIVEMTCKLMMILRRGQGKPAHHRLLQSILTKLGLTPADRTRVRVPSPKKKASRSLLQ